MVETLEEQLALLLPTNRVIEHRDRVHRHERERVDQPRDELSPAGSGVGQEGDTDDGAETGRAMQ